MTRRMILTAALSLLLIPILIFAQTQTEAAVTVDFYGTIETNLGSTLIINGRVVDISSAQMDGMILAPGVTVRIRAEVAPNGSLIAQQLAYVPVGFIPGLVELTGIISEINGSTLQIGDQMIDTTNARIVGALATGDHVQVFAHATNTTVWEARVVMPAEVILPPVATPEVGSDANAPIIVAPITTPEVVPQVNAPVTTPEIVYDDHGGNDQNDDHGGDSGGHGGGDDDGGSSGHGGGGSDDD